MKHVLIKLSAPGWEQSFDNTEDLRRELYAHICNYCREGEAEYHMDPVNEKSSIGELLSTPCGCEYMVEQQD